MSKLKYTTLPEITSKVMEARGNGTSEEVIQDFLKLRGWTTKRWEEAVNKQTKKEDAMPEEQKKEGGSFWDTVDGGLDSFMTGRTFGLAVPARAAGKWLGSRVKSGREPISFSEAVDEVQTEGKEFAEENPKTAMGMEIAGSMAGGMDIVPKAGVLAPVAGQTVRNLGRGVGVHGPLGALEGYGLSAAKDENTVMGTIAGAIGGIGGEALVPIGKWIGSKIITPIKNYISPPKQKGLFKKSGFTEAEKRGEQILEEVDVEDGITLDMKNKKLIEYKDNDLGSEVMGLDLMGKKGQGLAGTIMRHGGQVPAKAEIALTKRAARIRQNLFNFLQDASGGSRVSLKKVGDDLRKSASVKSKPVYQKAFYKAGERAKGMRTVAHPELDRLFKLPEFKTAYNDAVYLAKNDIDPVELAPFPKEGFPAGHEFPVYALDKVKKAIYSKFRGYQYSPDKNVVMLGSSMTHHKNRMLDAIGESIPEYKKARDIFAGEMEELDAHELGQKLFDSGDSMDKLYEFSTQLTTQSEKDAFRNAAFNVLSKKIESAATEQNPKGIAQYFLNEQNYHKLSLVIPDLAKREKFKRQTELLSGFAEVKNKILGGSPTAEKLSADVAEEDVHEGLRFAANVANKNVLAVADQAQKIGGGTRRAKRLDHAGETAYAQKGGEVWPKLNQNQITNRALRNQMRFQNLLQGSAGAGGVGVTQSLLQ